ncbi:hypothetical protein M0L20_22150 [Spirosoma sp. RP8]|uniref:Uncharacterized protein n=1 Tax=Spirosoma liriopis TaxID=2937440 RepID=A0ABT0HRX8_9BACT|nr:hypothetical protein [Spirosoma liriopis]MCK8494587.1 hypothetical protein [Spirosoma liriopis]
MKKGIILGALLVIATVKGQAQSTASGSSNTGNTTVGSTPAQNGSTGGTVSPSSKGSSMSQGGSKSNGRKVKTTSKTTRSRSYSSSGR